MTTDRALARREQNLERVNMDDITALVGWSIPDIQTIKRTVAPNITDPELALFARVCAKTGLDPFTRQIYAIARGTGDRRKLVIQIGIDGFRALAAETGRYLGSTEPLWADEDGNWRDVWLDKTPPAACKVGVYVRDAPAPTYATVMMAEFDTDNNQQYDIRPAHMLAVRAESHALRKAFPQALRGIELAGDPSNPAADLPRATAGGIDDLYPPEADAPDPFRARLAAPQREAPARETAPRLDPRIPDNGVSMRALHARAAEYGMGHEALRDFAAGLLEVEHPGEWSMKQLTQAQAQQVYAALGELVDVEPEPEFAPEE